MIFKKIIVEIRKTSQNKRKHQKTLLDIEDLYYKYSNIKSTKKSWLVTQP
jgi:uncharacterized protein (UPF0335 family)